MNHNEKTQHSNPFDLSIMVGLHVDRFVLSRYQLDIYFSDDASIESGIIVLEGNIVVESEIGSSEYNIQDADGHIVPGDFLGGRIVEILYVPESALSIRFQMGSTLTGFCLNEGNEFGSIRVFRGKVRFLLPLL